MIKVIKAIEAEQGAAGKDGVDGKDGESAYESAVAGGYEGSKEQFYEDLQLTKIPMSIMKPQYHIIKMMMEQ